MTAHTIPIRVVEWNVAMALHRKAHLLPDLAPSIAILPETAHPDRTRPALEDAGATKSSTAVQWIGANKHKGLSVVREWVSDDGENFGDCEARGV